MKASELIIILQGKIKDHGDLEVYRTCGFDIEDVDIVGDVEFQKGSKYIVGVETNKHYFYISL